MIDEFFIVVSTLAAVFIVVRALILDRRLPWFERVTYPPVGPAVRALQRGARSDSEKPAGAARPETAPGPGR